MSDIIENWKESEYFCPKCGKKTCFKEVGDGDYDLGPQVICISCDSYFYIPVLSDITLNHEKIVLKVIRDYVESQKLSAPTTLKNELPEKIVGAQREWFSSDTRKKEK